MTDLRKAAEMALEALENRGFAKPKGVTDAIKILSTALAPTKPDRDPAYAGVRMWIGDKEIEYWVTKTCIEHEAVDGMSMKLAANSCLQALEESNHD